MSDSLRPHESQHSRPPCPSPAPGVHSTSCPSSRWCHPAISSSVVPFSCPQSLPALPMSQLFAWGGQSTGVSALASFLPKNIQGWSPLEWTGPFLVINITYLYSLWVPLNFSVLWVHWNSGFMKHCQHDTHIEGRNGRHGLCIPLLTCMNSDFTFKSKSFHWTLVLKHKFKDKISKTFKIVTAAH